jgi:hypothetical protein
LTYRPHQEISAMRVNAACAVETDDAIITGQQDQECASSLNPEEKYSLGPTGDWYIVDSRRARRVLSKSNWQREE